MPCPASALRCSSSLTRWKRTPAISCGSSKVPSARGVRTVIISDSADLGIGLMERTYTTPANAQPVPAISRNAAAVASSSPIVPPFS